ncbi:hypothetical protein RJ639_046964 [Escallonia herrerae]|uniref:C2 domain-containing protein n=1 Tax=Escallonia herrerae TaxID=1293975 RepID=A0AA88W6M5_9ASTE|nr:hypothetical protein RJ639_046964 [Escallonia herrerae]
MDSSFNCLSSLSCELKIIRAKNTYFKSNGHLFVRCYLPCAGNKARVCLNTGEISSESNLCWNESFSLDCFGETNDSIDRLLKGNVVLELRFRRNKIPLFGRIGGSQLLGRAEIPWKSVLESPEIEFERWVVMVPTKRPQCLDGHLKPPAVQIVMNVQIPATTAVRRGRRRNGRSVKREECGCKSCEGCNDIFAIGAALEAF